MKFSVGQTATFLGLRLPVNGLIVPDALAESFRGPGCWGKNLTMRSKLLPRKDLAVGFLPDAPFIYNPAGQTGVIVATKESINLWIDEHSLGLPVGQPQDNGYFWLSAGKTYLIFEDELN
jgi:hypothetical protein